MTYNKWRNIYAKKSTKIQVQFLGRSQNLTGLVSRDIYTQSIVENNRATGRQQAGGGGCLAAKSGHPGGLA